MGKLWHEDCEVDENKEYFDFDPGCLMDTILNIIIFFILSVPFIMVAYWVYMSR